MSGPIKCWHWNTPVYKSNWAILSALHTHTPTHTHKAVQSWQAQQDRAFFLFIIYSPTQHTVASTSYRANIYSQHSSISPTKLFSSSARPFHYAMRRPSWFHKPILVASILWSGQIVLRGDISATEYMHAWTVLCMNGQVIHYVWMDGQSCISQCVPWRS